MKRHERRTLTVRVTAEEMRALYDAVSDYGGQLEVTAPAEAATLWPLMARLSEAWDNAAPKRRRKTTGGG